jgi:hypothetical protein
MGYRLVVVESPSVSVGGLWHSVKELVGNIERLRIGALGALDRALIQGMLTDFSRNHGLQMVGDIGKQKKFVPPAAGYISEMHDKSKHSITYQLVPPKGSKISLKLEPDESGVTVSRCANCGNSVTEKNPAISHNVIPQQIWKQIVDAAIDECLQHIESGSLTAKGVRSSGTLSGQQSGRSIDEKFRRANGENKGILDRLKAPALINSSYAAQDNVGKQCLTCEAKQSNATLLQRYALIKDKKLEPQIDSREIVLPTFIGAQLTGLAEQFKSADARACVKPGDMENLLGRVTMVQIGRFLVGIERSLSEDYAKNQQSPLTNLLLDHWDEFVWTFRSVAMTKCGAAYTGNLGIKGLTL